MPRRLLHALAALLLGTIALAEFPAAAAPDVVVSIKPIHALVAGVMAGVAEPGLIVGGAASPHVYSLRPSDARHLAAADLVFWAGPIMEGFLAKPLAALSGKAEIIELDRAPGVALLPARGGGSWEPDADEPPPAHGSVLEQDGHFFLDPAAARYAANGATLEQKLDALDASLRQRLAPLRGKPFVVFHDAYQYLERRYNLDGIGSITFNPENQPSARRLAAIHRKILALDARCVFSEPQFEPRLVQTLIEGTKARTGVLDPEGAALAPGPDLYFTLMDGLANSLTDCLTRPG
jgi:zinc transport system substrate-binding protein